MYTQFRATLNQNEKVALNPTNSCVYCWYGNLLLHGNDINNAFTNDWAVF